jgi:hypothetical protein
MALFAQPHSGSEKKRKTIRRLFSNQLWSIFYIDANDGGRAGLLTTNDFIFYLLESWFRAFLGYLFLNNLLVPKKKYQCGNLSSSVGNYIVWDLPLLVSRLL